MNPDRNPHRSIRILPLGLPLVVVGLVLCALAGCRSAPPRETAGPFAHEHHAVEVGRSHGVVGSGLRARVGQSAQIEPDEPFTELILSFNAEVPVGSGLVAEVAYAGEAGLFAPYLRIASWGEIPESWPTLTEAFGGRVAIDELLLDIPAARAMVRTVAFEKGGPVRIDRVDAVTTRVDPDRSLAPSPGVRIEWPVPFIGNTVDDPDLRSRLCSPTALNMLINHRAQRATRRGDEVTDAGDAPIAHAEVVDRVYSERFDLYGVWPRAIQTAYSLGFPGRLVRFGDWTEVRAHLETVGPLAISITARPGEVRNMPYESDNGHLIVLAGLTESGDAIVIDPALREEAEARRVYHAEDLTDVWFRRKRGTAYALFGSAASE